MVIWPIDRTLSGATTPGQNGPGSDGNKRLLWIPPSSSITRISLSDCLEAYTRTHAGGGLTPLQRSSRCILQPHPTGQSLRRVWVLIPLPRCSLRILQPQPTRLGDSWEKNKIKQNKKTNKQKKNKKKTELKIKKKVHEDVSTFWKRYL